jgi:hypothetical protein
MNRFIGSLLALWLLPSAAFAQVCPGGSTCAPLETYFYNQGAATSPYSSSLRVPVAPGPSANSLQYIPADALGGLTLISTQVASNSASLDFTGISSAYHYYRLVCSSLVPATNSISWYLRVGEGGGPTWQSASYTWAFQYVFPGGVGTNDSTAQSDTTGIRLSGNGVVNTAPGHSFTLDTFDPQGSGTGVTKSFIYQGLQNGPVHVSGYGTYTGDTNPITGIRVLASSGNITSGQCSLYGLNS